ncbi:hypothetical protein M413DRAFT_168192 [Hebeloma cylindrosporum]|uniref:Uncharacterized protein n=1 Tax=Hebeloma cylindrosporum TaxID=76867 RepID=A0A0C2XSX0_HEBCY|nr:hypothetical protein M413DRAFT_168192 [Hebeloma cylindrosporum h7]
MAKLLNALSLPISGIMTARFLLQLREWEHQATNGTEASHREGGFVINFKPGTEQDEDDENGGLDRGHRGMIHSEFGNDPVLEAKMRHGVNMDEGIDLGEVRTRRTSLAHPKLILKLTFSDHEPVIGQDDDCRLKNSNSDCV